MGFVSGGQALVSTGFRGVHDVRALGRGAGTGGRGRWLCLKLPALFPQIYKAEFAKPVLGPLTYWTSPHPPTHIHTGPSVPVVGFSVHLLSHKCYPG